MKKQTAKAIQRRLDMGMDEFVIGERRYFVRDHLKIVLYSYTDGRGSACPLHAGCIRNGAFCPDDYFSQDELIAMGLWGGGAHD